LLVAACVVPSSPIFVTLMKEAPGSSETSILERATRRNNPEDTNLHIWTLSEGPGYISVADREECCYYVQFSIQSVLEVLSPDRNGWK
jgi:hypothetical protein